MLNQEQRSSLSQSNFYHHLRAGGKLRYLVLTTLLALGRVPLAERLLILGKLIIKVENLAVGHIIESKSIKSTFAETEIPKGNIKSIDFKYTNQNVYDILIVGSGPGGAVAASKINSNSSILILEAGEESSTTHRDHHTLKHVQNDFFRGGQELILNKELSQFAQAKVFGGGSEVNSGLYHKLPKSKYDEFLSKSHIDEKTWLESEERIYKRLRISKSPANPNDSVIARGAEKMTLSFENIPRWRTYHEGGDFSHHGMTDVFWKELSSRENIEFKLGVQVRRIFKSGQVFQVETLNKDGLKNTFYAHKIIMAAGTTQTPYLLAKSGFISWSDTSFQWHPMYRRIVRTSQSDLGLLDIDPFQAWTSGHTLKFGSAVSTPGLLATNIGTKIFEEDVNTLRSYYVSFSSSGRGGLIPNTSVPWYRFSALDKKLKVLGQDYLESMLLSGGGSLINSSGDSSGKSSTVHIFGSLPLDTKIYVEGTCRLKSDENIQIADGSILPIGPGVNPQGVIMTTVDVKVEA
jgi:hypothetical protein